MSRFEATEVPSAHPGSSFEVATRRLWTAAAVVGAVALGLLSSSGPLRAQIPGNAAAAVAGATAAPVAHAASPFLVAGDVVYLEGGDPVLQSLDVYAPPGASALPVLLYVHGGAMFYGDKRNVGDKPDFLCSRGWVLVSINYRLSPAVKHPAHVEDAAAAVAWVVHNIARYGGDPGRMALLGHSAGALVASLLATDERRLGAHGLSLDTFRAVVLLEGQEYDLETRMQWAQTAMPERLEDPYSKFGDTPEEWRDITVLRHVAAGKGIPPALLVACGVQFQFYVPGEESKKMLSALWRAGVDAEYFLAAEKNHGGVNDDLTSGDEMSRAVMAFLARRLEGG